MTHTPGPWHIDDRKVGSIYEFDIVGPKGEDIGFANLSDGADERTMYPARENAQLMAAAPELLEALHEAVQWIDPDDTRLANRDEARAAEQLCLAAIAKAEGR